MCNMNKYLIGFFFSIFLIACERQTEKFSVGIDKLHTNVGVLEGGAIKTSGKFGHLVYGPYIPLKMGSYRLVAKGNLSGVDKALGTIDVASDGGTRIIAVKQIVAGESAPGDIVSLDFEIKQPSITSVEFRIVVSSQTIGSFTAYEITRVE